MLPHERWLPFWEEVFRREVADELLQDPNYGDITHPVSCRAFGHDIDSVEPKRTKINRDRTVDSVDAFSRLFDSSWEPQSRRSIAVTGGSGAVQVFPADPTGRSHRGGNVNLFGLRTSERATSSLHLKNNLTAVHQPVVCLVLPMAETQIASLLTSITTR